MKESTLQFYKERMLRVLVHIQRNLDEPLALNKLAALACLSPYHFHHVFTGMIGEPLAGHIRRLRLERAARRLKLTRLSVLEIALEAGFESHEAFSRAFRSSFKESPTEFRRRHASAAQISARSGVHFHLDSAVRGFRVVRTGDTIMNVKIKLLEPMHVAFVRHIGPYNKVGTAWENLMMFLGKEGLIGGGTQFIGICHDDPAVTPAQKVRYDACATVDQRFPPEGEIGAQVIPSGEYAVMTHFGPYHRLGKSYAKLLGQWLPRSHRHLRSTPCLEMYLNSPENTEPRDLVTDLYAPLEPIQGGYHANA